MKKDKEDALIEAAKKKFPKRDLKNKFDIDLADDLQTAYMDDVKSQAAKECHASRSKELILHPCLMLGSVFYRVYNVPALI